MSGERERAILTEVRHVYGSGSTVKALASDIDSRWDGWVRGEGDAVYHGIEYAVQMVCWNWFSGGGRAEIAARRIVAAVAGVSVEKETGA